MALVPDQLLTCHQGLPSLRASVSPSGREEVRCDGLSTTLSHSWSTDRAASMYPHQRRQRLTSHDALSTGASSLMGKLEHTAQDNMRSVQSVEGVLKARCCLWVQRRSLHNGWSGRASSKKWTPDSILILCLGPRVRAVGHQANSQPPNHFHSFNKWLSICVCSPSRKSRKLCCPSVFWRNSRISPVGIPISVLSCSHLGLNNLASLSV